MVPLPGSESPRLRSNSSLNSPEHPGAGSAGGTSGAFKALDLGIGDVLVASPDHGIDEIYGDDLARPFTLPASMGPPDTKTGDVEDAWPPSAFPA